jgi:hypothetical protein
MSSIAQPSYVFDLISLEQPSRASLDLLNMPVKRKDTGEMVALGEFLAAVTAAQMFTASGTPAVTALAWGKMADSSVFYQMISALKLIGLCGAEWNAEGVGWEWDSGRFLQWVSAYAVAESTETTYLEVSPVANGDKVQSVMDAWVGHIVQPVTKDDPLSIMIIAVATTPELAHEIKEAAKASLEALCFLAK